MGKGFRKQAFSFVVIGVVLVCLSPVVPGMLLCISEEPALDCCPGSRVGFSSQEAAEQVRGGSDCECCITIDGPPSTLGTTAQKASVVLLPGRTSSREAVLPATAHVTRADSSRPGNPHLASLLRTVVLLI